MNLERVNIVLAGDENFLGRHIRDRLLAIGAAPVFLVGDEYDLAQDHDVACMYDKLTPKIVVHIIPDAKSARSAHSAMTKGLHLTEYASVRRVHKYALVGPAGPYTSALTALLQTYRRDYHLNGISLTHGEVYGDSTAGIVAGVVRGLCEANKGNQKEAPLWGPRGAMRDFLYAKDVARGVVLALQDYDGSEPLMFRSGEEITIRSLAEQIKELVGFVGKIKWNGPHPHYPESICTTLADKHIDFYARTPLEEGLRKTIQWYRKQG